ncbi:MAG TPA: hypothetical protein VHI13_19970, partial [Candidatus Kapabacteria bacterium]|nr:hypothetical protein [Candidatus Kapabacteria bacterium]
MYRQHGKLLAAITIALAATFTTAAAQTTVRGVIGSGGTSTSSGAITINATLGQAVTGPSGSSTRALQGFWYTLTPPPPAAVPGEENATAAAMQCAPNPVSAQAELRVRIDHSG